jgi:hypothetical protein
VHNILNNASQAVDTDEGDLASQQGKRRAAPDEAEEGLSETEGAAFLHPIAQYSSWTGLPLKRQLRQATDPTVLQIGPVGSHAQYTRSAS